MIMSCHAIVVRCIKLVKIFGVVQSVFRFVVFLALIRKTDMSEHEAESL